VLHCINFFGNSSIYLFNMSKIATICDCFGVQYKIKPMPPNGLCSYYSLAYALTGAVRDGHKELIKDLLAAFYVNPDLFVQQTEFAKRNPNLSLYECGMLKTVANVGRQDVPSLYWYEDAHIVAFCML